MVLPIPLIRLACGVNNYDWGKKGEDSAAAQLASLTPENKLSIDPSKTYSELWMGTHPKLPSHDVRTARPLSDLVKENSALLSPHIVKKYGEKLPFLFKVLSIQQALSIQAHPNKKLAEQLHKQDSKNYPDDNHKPEMTIALTPFQGLCGFKPLDQISKSLDEITPLRSLVGDSAAKDFQSKIVVKASPSSGETASNKAALKALLSAIMKTSPTDLKTHIQELLSFLSSDSCPLDPDVRELIKRLHSDYPEDIGLFVQFLLNHVTLQPGEAMFLKADDVHAYIAGDCIECMAASDNVVRAGFTPKFKDVNTLLEMLTYDTAPIEEQKLEPKPYPYVALDRAAYSAGSEVALYDPPIDEFSVLRISLKSDRAKATFEPIDGPSILLCTKGIGSIAIGEIEESITRGSVFFVGAGANLVLKSKAEELEVFRAFCEIEDDRNGKL